MKDLKQLTKDPNAAAKARAAEQRANEDAGMKSINIPLAASSSAGGASTGKKKPVFKSTLQPHNAAALGQTEVKASIPLDDSLDAAGAMRNGWYEDRYQPNLVTGCEDPRCNTCRANGGMIDLSAHGADVTMTG